MCGVTVDSDRRARRPRGRASAMTQEGPPLLELLRDVGRFVVDTLSTEKLSGGATAQREILVRNLKRYLPHMFQSQYLDMTVSPSKGKHVSAVFTTLVTPVDGNEYVGSDAPALDVEEDYEECPEAQPVVIEPSREETLPPPPQVSYTDLKATSPKSGPLMRSEKRFFREQFRGYWAGISGHLLVFYEKERDSKPASVISLVGFQARAAPDVIRDPKKKHRYFELICPGKKTNQLLARTPKDMEQWLAAISEVCQVPRESPVLIRRQLPLLPEDSDSEVNYDDVGGSERKPTSSVDVEEEFYHVISVSSEHGSDNDSIYDDIAAYSGSVYYNMGLETRIPPQTDADSQTSLKPLNSVSKPSDPEEESDEIYDDISSFEDPMATSNNSITNTFARNGREQVLQKLSNAKQSEDLEELYDDISAFEETPSKDTKPVSSEPFVPSKTNKESVSVALDHEEEDFYDDVPVFDETPPKVVDRTSLIPNEPALSRLDRDASPRPPIAGSSSIVACGEKEEIYDDIQPCEEAGSNTIERNSPKTNLFKTQNALSTVNLKSPLSKDEDPTRRDHIVRVKEIIPTGKKQPLRETTVSRIAKDFSSQPSQISQQFNKRKENESSNGVSTTTTTTTTNVTIRTKKPFLNETPSKLHSHIMNLEEVLGRGKTLKMTGLTAKGHEGSCEPPVEASKLKPKPNVKPVFGQRKLVR